MGQHWYTKEGEPMHWVTGANGKQRDTTLRDAKKLNLYPSVSGVSDQIDKPGLNNWKLNKLLYAALTLPRPEGISDDEFLKLVRDDAAREAEEAKLRGDLIHNCMEAIAMGIPKEFPEDVQAIGDAAFGVVCDYTGTSRYEAEKTFASPLGYGGMVDLLTDEYDERYLIDHKTKDITDTQWELYEAGKNPKIAWPNNCQQLVAYDHGLGNSGRRLVNVYIDRSIVGRIIIHEWEGPIIDKEWKKFQHLLHHWQDDKGYRPE